jgi:hypothetical protein
MSRRNEQKKARREAGLSSLSVADRSPSRRMSEAAIVPALRLTLSAISRYCGSHAVSWREGDGRQIERFIAACSRSSGVGCWLDRHEVHATNTVTPPVTERGGTMLERSLVIIAACAGLFSLNAEARPVSTDDCLKRGQCAYVSPNGRVTCGKCPGQIVQIPADATAVCKDGAFDNRKSRSGACKGHGGVVQFLDPKAKSAELKAQETR